MKTNHLSPFLSALLLLVVVNISAQDTKTSVILYNSEAYLAEITTDGKIVNLIEKKPNYLKGYNIVKDQNFSADFVASERVQNSASGTLSTGSTVSADRKFITFKTQYATLDDISLQRLDRVINYLNANPLAKVMITSHRIDDSNNTIKLSNNRIDSCQKYLEMKGILVNRIISTSVYAPSLKDKIAISYINNNI